MYAETVQIRISVSTFGRWKNSAGLRLLGIPVHRDQPFRLNVTDDSDGS
ncbi:hypothetical protein IMCC9480_1310 [Oxalobacteraceae bacterium IMCC9480]|nr:hypothetical protein IMCC9480_1310 [Oxalobacteraceae bacterium IMCC9480]